MTFICRDAQRRPTCICAFAWISVRPQQSFYGTCLSVICGSEQWRFAPLVKGMYISTTAQQKLHSIQMTTLGSCTGFVQGRGGVLSDTTVYRRASIQKKSDNVIITL
jgi:hypothetical protein